MIFIKVSNVLIQLILPSKFTLIWFLVGKEIWDPGPQVAKDPNYELGQKLTGGLEIGFFF